MADPAMDVPMFDVPPARPSAIPDDADGRPVVPCLAIGPQTKKPDGRWWTPRCNRLEGHDGNHALVRRRDFARLAEWS